MAVKLLKILAGFQLSYCRPQEIKLMLYIVCLVFESIQVCLYSSAVGMSQEEQHWSFKMINTVIDRTFSR